MALQPVALPLAGTFAPGTYTSASKTYPAAALVGHYVVVVLVPDVTANFDFDFRIETNDPAQGWRLTAGFTQLGPVLPDPGAPVGGPWLEMGPWGSGLAGRPFRAVLTVRNTVIVTGLSVQVE